MDSVAISASQLAGCAGGPGSPGGVIPRAREMLAQTCVSNRSLVRPVVLQ
jgi:hypothetical protein